MLSAARQLAYLQARLDSVAGKLAHISEVGVGMEELHALRVELKKVKALLFFASRCHGKRKVWEDYRYIKPLFQAAGVVRERQISKKIMQGKSLDIPAKLDRQIALHSEDFVDKIPKFQAGLTKFRKKSTVRLSDISSDSVFDFFARQKKKVKEEVLHHKPGTPWHDARKRLKVMMYILAVLPKKSASELQLSHRELDELQELLGDWHDLLVLNQLYAEWELPAEKSDTRKLEQQIKKAVSKV